MGDGNLFFKEGLNTHNAYSEKNTHHVGQLSIQKTSSIVYWEEQTRFLKKGHDAIIQLKTIFMFF